MNNLFGDGVCHEEFLNKSERLYDYSEVERAIHAVSQEVNRELEGDDVLVITILQGGLVFSGMLVPQLSFPLTLDYTQFSRYGHNKEGGDIRVPATPKTSMEGKTVLLVDDIYDRGETLKVASELCVENGAKKVVAAVLVKKVFADVAVTPLIPNFKLFYALEVPDKFVFGMGMDVEDYFRNAAGIFAAPL